MNGVPAPSVGQSICFYDMMRHSFQEPGMRVVVVGFPKSGTSTLQKAFAKSGLNAVHWRMGADPVGELIYQGLFRHDDPFFLLPGVDAITQMDYCVPAKQRNFWPNLDFSVLFAIRRRYPDCLLLLNRRDPQATAQSMLRWRDLADRLKSADIPGLPSGFGGTAEELVCWIEAHHRAVVAAFGDDRRFLDLDIAASDAPELLGRALGMTIAWWGVENSNPGPAGAEPVALQPVATGVARS
ncbi:hypothetical protein ACVFYP_03885 [Roseomonas sp. F4]